MLMRTQFFDLGSRVIYIVGTPVTLRWSDCGDTDTYDSNSYSDQMWAARGQDILDGTCEAFRTVCADVVEQNRDWVC